MVMSEAAAPHAPAHLSDVLDRIAADQKAAGIVPLSDEEAAALADEAVAQTRLRHM
jgi:hypothetical protein